MKDHIITRYSDQITRKIKSWDSKNKAERELSRLDAMVRRYRARITRDNPDLSAEEIDAKVRRVIKAGSRATADHLKTAEPFVPAHIRNRNTAAIRRRRRSRPR